MEEYSKLNFQEAFRKVHIDDSGFGVNLQYQWINQRYMFFLVLVYNNGQYLARVLFDGLNDTYGNAIIIKMVAFKTLFFHGFTGSVRREVLFS